MKSNYRKIGELIRLVDERNAGLKVTTLLWLSISKEFIPSVANIIGTDMENYKIIRKDQFACSLMQVRRDKKIPIALLRNREEAIISQAYPVFEVMNKNILLPEYLMMWFSREEFDRESCFYAVWWVRWSLEWSDFCDMELPIPSIEKQREIVTEYKVLINRINLNNTLMEKLEDTAQALYKQWFVDFEFPNSEGNPYKSSGGEMEYCKELKKNVPRCWKMGILSDLIEVKYGKEYSHLMDGNIPLYWSGGIMKKVSASLYSKPSILIPRKGTLTNIMYVNHPFWCVDTMFYSIFKIDNIWYYTYLILKQLDFSSLDQGSAVPSMTTAYLNSIQVVIPEKNITNHFSSILEIFYKNKEILELELQRLFETKNTVLSKMASVG